MHWSLGVYTIHIPITVFVSAFQFGQQAFDYYYLFDQKADFTCTIQDNTKYNIYIIHKNGTRNI